MLAILGAMEMFTATTAGSAMYLDDKCFHYLWLVS